MNKKFLRIFTLIVISMFGCNVAKADNFINLMDVSMTDSQIETLRNLGFTDEEIDRMNLEEFNKNKDLDAKLISQNTKYYKIIEYIPFKTYSVSNNTSENNVLYYSKEISKEEYDNPDKYDNGISTQDKFTQEIINTEYKQMTTSISYVNSNAYRFKNSLKWKKAPKTRSYDIIAIGFDNKVASDPSTKTFYMSYTEDDSNKGTCGYKSTSTTYLWKSSSKGEAAVIKLPENTGRYTRYEFDMYMYFNVRKAIYDPIIALDAYGDYKHAQKKVSLSPTLGIGISSEGISFEASVSPSITKSYDAISTSHATASIYWN